MIQLFVLHTDSDSDSDRTLPYEICSKMLHRLLRAGQQPMRNPSIRDRCSRRLFGGGKIEDREVNSLFDSKESYSGSIILLQERGDIHA